MTRRDADPDIFLSDLATKVKLFATLSNLQSLLPTKIPADGKGSWWFWDGSGAKLKSALHQWKINEELVLNQLAYQFYRTPLTDDIRAMFAAQRATNAKFIQSLKNAGVPTYAIGSGVQKQQQNQYDYNSYQTYLSLEHCDEKICCSDNNSNPRTPTRRLPAFLSV